MMMPINIGASLTFCPALNLQASSLSGPVLSAQLPMSTKAGLPFPAQSKRKQLLSGDKCG